MSREAMQMALEALEKVITAFGPGLTLQQRAITALRQALETEKQWVGLTDEEITELHHEIKVRLMGTYKTEDIYRAVEAKLKEKNG